MNNLAVSKLLKRYLFFAKFLFTTGTFFAQNNIDSLLKLLNSNYKLALIKVLKTIKKENTIVTFIEDEKKNKFCVRQKKLQKREKDFCFVREVLGSYVAESANIPASRVRILPKELHFPGKTLSKKYGTLQTRASGTDKYHVNLHLQQRLKDFPLKEQGLTRQVIKNMSMHPDLPLIVALDTFISNPDRSNNNLFYDKKTDCFCAIDLDLAFKLPCRRDLSSIACIHIIEMLLKKVELDKRELKGLQSYTKTLKELFDKNPPMHLYQLLKDIALQVGFLHNSDDPMHYKLERYKDKISRQYKSTELLIWLLNQFIANQA